ncbi:hypothetical protein F5Y17DRAFT_415949 [Xylariaceae sp. FL0594]|nr:hypothetical protein F5Y17DRAFT_415949 [Xylariaceae sp. FL0594]
MMQVSANKHHSAQHHQRLCHDDPHSKPTGTLTHSGRLVYANPQDLPSFPSIGLDATGSAASAAATLGWANQNKNSAVPWKPETSAAASTAATMAEDHKAAAHPKAPLAINADSTKAALLAAQSATTHSPRKPAFASHGMSAATLAFKSNRAETRTPHSGTPERHRSLVAAKGAVARRQRAESAPLPRESYPDEANAAANALSAANRAHRPVLSPSLEGGAVPYTTMSKQMFTSRPPVRLEVDEQKRADVLHASAVAMAKKMYTQQQKIMEAKKSHADKGPSRGDLEVSSSVSDDRQPAQLTTLQDAAYKQAQARLAKMHQENMQNRDLEEYYGTRPLSRRFSVAAKLRKRASSDGAATEDQRRSQQIRKQMSLFSNRLSEIDEQKRQQDQEFLLAAARRNVHERLRGMDEKIASETGMMPPSTRTQWEQKARAVAHTRASSRGIPHPGKIDLGSGKYMDQEEINAIAAQRIQPILDEINEKAELERARQLELRLDAERKKDEREAERVREKEVHDYQKKLRQQCKQEEKERRAEAKRTDQERSGRAERARTPQNHRPSREDPEPARDTESSPPIYQVGDAQARDGSPSGKRRLKTWFRDRLSRVAGQSDGEHKKGESSFIGGAAAANIERDGDRDASSVSDCSASARAVALAGRDSMAGLSQFNGEPDPVSPLSTSDYRSSHSAANSMQDSADDLHSPAGGQMPKTHIVPPGPVMGTKPVNDHINSGPSNRDSRFRENFD